MALCWVTIWRMSVLQDITRIHPRRTKTSHEAPNSLFVCSYYYYYYKIWIALTPLRHWKKQIFVILFMLFKCIFQKHTPFQKINCLLKMILAPWIFSLGHFICSDQIVPFHKNVKIREKINHKPKNFKDLDTPKGVVFVWSLGSHDNKMVSCMLVTPHFDLMENIKTFEF